MLPDMIFHAREQRFPTGPRADRSPTEPLGGTVRFIGVFLLGLTALAVLLGVTGHSNWSIGGFGNADVCATQSNVSYGVETPSDPSLATRPGATVNVAGTAMACASHLSLTQRLLKTLTTLPASLVWLAVLFLLWRLVRSAERYGPFTAAVASLLRLTGWFIIGGSVLATVAQSIAADALRNTMFRNQHDFGNVFVNPGPLFPPLLAGVVALTFARIVRRGVQLDEDLQGTV